MNSKKTITIIGVIAGIILLSWILTVYTPQNTLKDEEEKQWVWIELEVSLPRDTSDYFYYGEINKSLIKIINSKSDQSGLFMLSNMRYWDDEGLLEIYEDSQYSGSKVFQIQAIQHLILAKGDPVMLLDKDELGAEAIRLRAEGHKMSEEVQEN